MRQSVNTGHNRYFIGGSWSQTVGRRIGILCVLSLGGAPLARATAQSPAAAADTSARNALLNAIRRGNPALTANRATLGAAEARVRAAAATPPLTLSGEVEEVSRGGIVSALGSARLDLSREFVPSALKTGQRSIAQADAQHARVVLALVERTLVVRADLLLTQAAASVLIARRLAAEDSLLLGAEESVRTRFAVGDARYVDVLRLRTERLRIQTERATARTNASVSRRALAALVTGDVSDALGQQLVDSALAHVLRPAPTRTTVFAPLDSAPALDSLIAASGVVRLARVELARAEAARYLALAEGRPQLSASLGAQRFEKRDGGHSVGPTAGFSVSLPFSARSTNAARVAASEQVVAAARARLRAATTNASSELATARERYESVRERLALYDAALLRGAREERESALASYRSGELSLVELLDFERALARAEIAQLLGRIDAAEAYADLLGGASGDVEDVLPNVHSMLRSEIR